MEVTSAMSTRRPNVILILSDQMQYRRQGRLDPESSTPHLDGLAEAGVDFSHCFVSNPQCTPSRTSLLTGLHPHEAGVMTNYGFFDHSGHVDETHDTVGQAFARAGYRTAYFGKSHLGFPLQRLGYEVVEDHGGVVGGLAEVDRSIAADACDFIRTAPRDRPFFLTVSFHEPHPPFELVPGFEPEQETFARPASMRDPLDGRPEFQLRRQRSDEGAMTEGRYDDEVRRYLSMIAHLDSLVGDLVAGVREAGAWDDTVVAFTSDHGDLMGAHGMRLKGTLPYDELFRVPLIVKGVDSPDLGVVDDLVSNVAIPATLLDLAGVARTGAWHARSRLPMPSLAADGSGARSSEGEMVFAQHYAAYWGVHPFRLVRTREWKLVQYYGPDRSLELYDLRSDPSEQRNVVDEPAHADVVASLAGALDSWWVATGGRDFDYYESKGFRRAGASDLLDDNVKWAMT